MKRHVLAFVFVCLAAATARGNSPFLLGGIQVNEDDHQRWTAALHQAGMNTVQATVYAHQGAWHGPDLWFADEEPAVLVEIRAARQAGLRVVLIPRVALDHNEPDNLFLWHGLIYPRTEAALAEWFRRYTAFVVKWARVAEDEGVQVFGVGSEMNSLAATLPIDSIPNLPAWYLDDGKQGELRALYLENRRRLTTEVRASIGAADATSLDDLLCRRNQAERAWARIYTFANDPAPTRLMNRRRQLLTRHWQDLVEAVRAVYSGTLTFAANFDSYQDVAFWDRLDLVGINAYFPLRRSPTEPLRDTDLVESWRRIFCDIDGFRERNALEQRVLFTELGYSRYRGVTVAPWTAHGLVHVWNPPEEARLLIWDEQPTDPDERARAVQALHSLQSRSLAGILYWKLSSRSDLERYEPFMLDLGLDTDQRDPLLDSLALFSDEAPPDCATLPLPEPPLTTCVRLDQADAVRRILESDPAAIDRRTDDGRTALHLAADQASAKTVRRLLAAGASAGATDRGGVTSLHVAARRGLASIVALLAQATGAGPQDDAGNRPLHYAAYHGKRHAFLQLWRWRHAWGRDRNGRSLLHHAAHGGDTEILRKALRFDRRVNRRDRAGRTALHEAVEKGRVEAVRLLLSSGARIGQADRRGQTALHLAAAGTSEHLVPLVIERDPNLDVVDEGGNTPLHYAAAWGRLENIRRLLSAGALSALRNDRGQTAQETAAAAGRKRAVALLDDAPQVPEHQVAETPARPE